MTVTRIPGKLTYEDYVQIPDDGNRYELLEGEIYMTPAPSPDHQRTVGRLYLLFYPAAEAAGAEVFLSPIDVRLDDDTVVQPDLLVLTSGQRHLVGSQSVEGAPALVVEILSPGTAKRDRDVKAALYARAGVGEYWLVSPEAALIEVWVLEEGSYRLHCRAGHDEPVSSTIFPDLSFPASAVFKW